MAWTNPATWFNGQLVGAAALNEQVRDNQLHLKVAVADDGRITALDSARVADLSGANLTGVLRTAAGNTFTAGTQDFNAGASTRLVLPVGSDRWAT